LRLGKSPFEQLIEHHPRSVLSLVSLLVRLRDTASQVGEAATMRTAALVPMGIDVDHRGVARNLADKLTTLNQRVAVLDSAGSATEWFNVMEATNDLVLSAEPESSGWTRLCLRQDVNIRAFRASRQDRWAARTAAVTVTEGGNLTPPTGSHHAPGASTVARSSALTI
jgi:hypothetical protein